MALATLGAGDDPGSLRLTGELDMSTVEAIGAQLQDALRGNGVLNLDLDGLTFMDSQGLRMLIELGKQAVDQATTVRILACSRPVRSLLDLAVPEGIPGVDLTDLGHT
jgi:anti-anti-sigma factor